MRIAWLRDHPWHVDALAAAHVEAFGALLPDWTLAQAADELRSHTRACAIPSTLLALDEQGGWLGSVSLLQEDHEHIRQYSPWLASLYVRPQARGQGVGAALVARAVADFRAQARKVLPLCPFAAAQFRRHPEWADLLQERKA